MTDLIKSIDAFAQTVSAPAHHGGADAASVRESLETMVSTDSFQALLDALIQAPAFSSGFGQSLADRDAVEAIFHCRTLTAALNLPIGQFLHAFALAVSGVAPQNANRQAWVAFADNVTGDEQLASMKLLRFLTQEISNEAIRQRYRDLASQLVDTDPHAIYPTSAYRRCEGSVHASADESTVEAVMSFSTYSSIRVADRVLDPTDRTIRDIYLPFGRCVCFIDSNVEETYGDELEAYFATNEIPLERMVYRAMEVDKGISTVERMLGDLKRVGIGRHEPVFLIGGGVLADTGGLACALYGRNTPYVMLSTSIVTGIDAGPSPRTCCDGFGYKNLLGAYHPPVVSLTDRFFFKSLEDGWVRHGVAEIIKMAVVKNFSLFEDLEKAMDTLVPTRFGTLDCAIDDPAQDLYRDILGKALKSYIEAEYGNLYETHQCRPHAYGHTWSPGFEIEAGLLHGHAVAIGMGLGAYLSFRNGSLGETDLHRILRLMSGYGLSLWHDVLHNEATMLESHRKIIQKRGGNLVAPVPVNSIGECGYLNDVSEADLLAAIAEYKAICDTYPRAGLGIEPLCTDVGLEDPSTASPSMAA